MIKTIIAAIIITVVLISVFAVVDNTLVNPSSQSNAGTTSEYVEEGTISVTISGEVVRPGTYLVDEDSTLETLVNAASGVTSNADSRCYYLDYVLAQGMSFYIAPIYDNSDVCAVTPIEKKNINSADKAALMEIGAIGTSLAEAILDYREGASFRALEEIKNVAGIGPATFEKVKDYICLRD